MAEARPTTDRDKLKRAIKELRTRLEKATAAEEDTQRYVDILIYPDEARLLTAALAKLELLV